MRKFLLALAVILAASPACATTTMLQAIDTTAPDTSCDVATGTSPARVRNCYVPSWSGTWGPAHANPAFSINFTLAAPTAVLVTYDQVFFLSTIYGAAPQYAVGIGIDNTTSPCGMQSGGNIDSPQSVGSSGRAVCLVTLQAGPHTVYALEEARSGAFSYRAAVNQVLIVSY